MAWVINRQEGIEPECGVDDFILEAFCPGRGVGQASQDNRVLSVLISLLLDHHVKTFKILWRETIENTRVADLCQPPLDRALPVSDFARNQEHDVPGTLPSAEAQPI